MQKKLLLFCVVTYCMVVQAIVVGDERYDDYADYKGQKSHAFIEALRRDLPGAGKAIDEEFQNHLNENKKEEEDAILQQDDSKPGYWATPATVHSTNGRILQEFAQRRKSKDEISKKLLEQAQKCKDGFNLAYEIDRKLFIMNEIYVKGLEKCGNDKDCLREHDDIKWEHVSAPGFIEKQCSTVYNPVIYQGEIVMTREQKIEAIQKNQQLKELADRLQDIQKQLQDKIDSLNQKK